MGNLHLKYHSLCINLYSVNWLLDSFLVKEKHYEELATLFTE